MERIDQIYNYYLSKFSQVNDFKDQKNYEIIITSLHRYCSTRSPYVYDFLYCSKDFENNCCKLIDKRTQDLYSIIDKNKDAIINFFKPYTLIPKTELNENKPHIVDNFYQIISNFLVTINPKLCLLFKDIIDKNNLLHIQNYDNGEELYDKIGNTIYILLGCDKSVNNMITLVHELGHAYYDSIYHEYHDADDINKILKKEIPSQALELRFIKYLIENDIYKEIVQRYLMNFNNLIIDDAKETLNELKKKPSLEQNITTPFTYSLGKIIAHYSIINNIQYDDLINYIHENNIERLINQIDSNKIVNNDEMDIIDKPKVKHY